MSGAVEAAPLPRNHLLALNYGKAGLAVFPCNANKAPAIKRGFHAATAEVTEIQEMWTSRGGRSPVGLPCGEVNGITVVDLDMSKKTGDATGEESVKKVLPTLFDSDGAPTVPAVRTPSGGWHLYFQYTPDLKTGTGFLSCVDIRSKGGYVLAPFSDLGEKRIYNPNPLMRKHLQSLEHGHGSLLPEMPEVLLAALLAGDKPASDLSQSARPLSQQESTLTYQEGGEPSEGEVQCCLDHISPDGYDNWYKVLSALKSYPNGKALARNWSAKSSKHKDKDFEKKWEKVDAVPVRSLFSMAKENGADLSSIAIDYMPKVDDAEMAKKAQKYSAKLDAYFAGNVVPINAKEGAAIAAQFSQDSAISKASGAAEGEGPANLPFKPWSYVDAAKIPRVQFVYGSYLAKGYTSVTAASPKVGKSLLALAEAVDIACGRGFLTNHKREPQNILYYCAEDDQDTINARVIAILKAWGIDQTEIEGRLFAVSGIDITGFALVAGQEGVINEPLFKLLETFCTEHEIDCAIFDPLQDLSHSPESNEVFRLLGSRLRKFAVDCDLAIGLIHHTRKGMAGAKASIEDMRGGSALRGTARFNRLLVAMSEDEAAQAGLDNHRPYMRVAESESNLAPPASEQVQWFEKVSVSIENGASIGVVKPWSWPNAFTGVSRQDAARVRRAVQASVVPPRSDVRAKEWVGHIVAQELNLDMEKKAEKARVKAIIKTWVDTDVLRVCKQFDAQRKREVEVVISGDNNPLEVTEDV